MRRLVVATACVIASVSFAQDTPAEAPPAPTEAAAPAPSAAPEARPPPKAEPKGEAKPEANAEPKPRPKAEAATDAAATSPGGEARPAAGSASPAVAPAVARPSAVQPAAGSGSGAVEPAAARTRKAEPKPDAPRPSPEAAEAAAHAEKLSDLMKQAQQVADPNMIPDELLKTTPKQDVEAIAREFFLHLVSGDARAMMGECALPFMVEDKRFTQPEALFEEWLSRVRSKRVDLLVLYGIEVLTPDEMEKKYGKPPARLASFPWRGPKTYIAVANLSGRPAVAVFKEVSPTTYLAIGYHD